MLISTVSFGLLAVGSIIVFARKAILLKRMGACEHLFLRKSNRQFVGILLCSPLLVSLGYWKDFGPVATMAISCAGLLGFIVSLSDIIFIRIGGVYEKGLIWNSAVVFFDRVSSFAQIDPYTIEMCVVGRGRKTFVFSDTHLAQGLRAKLENYREYLQ